MIDYGAICSIPQDLPYVNSEVDLGGRSVQLVPYYVHESAEWFAVAEVKQGEYRRIRLVDVASGILLSDAPPKPSEDIQIPIADLLFHKLSYPNLLRPMNGFFDVVENLASTMELYEHAVQMHDREIPGAQQIAQTLVSLLLILCRSVYDIVHKISREACSTVVHLDDHSKPVIQTLHKRISRLILDGDKMRSADELINKYNLPRPLADFYSDQAPTFSFIRQARDRVVHRGSNVGKPGYIFNLDEGLGISLERGPWTRLDIWDDTSVSKGRFGSLRKLFAHLIREALGATTAFASAFASCVALPGAISPGNHLYLRSPLNHHLMNIEAILAAPWERRPVQDEAG